ncbi:VOC family protein [Tateyamaria sp. SN6-1]|uniref:VOC family protein n=1 Tax=Tateyamaria sp. SN6-1 TaxID=3092148 RepID=UPI0039F4E6B0
MGIQRLDHVNVVTRQLPQMIAWYETVLGLRSGHRPDFPFPGAWLYAGDVAVVHLVAEDADRVGAEAPLRLEHFAFSASDAATFEATLTRQGQPFDKTEVTGAGLVQFHVADPDGNHIHVDFDLSN